MSEGPSESSSWLPDEALNAMIMERSVHRGEDNKGLSRRLLDENTPVATQSMIWLAIHSQSERIRLDASKYLIDRSLGRIGEEQTASEDSETTKFLESVLSDVDQM